MNSQKKTYKGQPLTFEFVMGGNDSKYNKLPNHEMQPIARKAGSG